MNPVEALRLLGPGARAAVLVVERDGEELVMRARVSRGRWLLAAGPRGAILLQLSDS